MVLSLLQLVSSGEGGVSAGGRRRVRSLQCCGTIGLRHGTEGGDASIRLGLRCETVLQVVGRVVVQAVQISEGTLQ